MLKGGLATPAIETGFDHVPPEVEQQVKCFTQSMGSSLIVERMFNEGRRVESANRNEKIEPCTFYHATSLGPRVMPDFGRPQMAITGAARLASPGRIPASAFGASEFDTTVGTEVLDRLMTPKPDWPRLAPQSWKQSALAWQLALASGGSWTKIEKSYWSLLMVPDTLVIHKSDPRAKIVVYSCKFGFLSWRTPVDRSSFLVGFGPSAKESLEFGHVENMGGWKALGATQKVARTFDLSLCFRAARYSAHPAFGPDLFPLLLDEVGVWGRVR